MSSLDERFCDYAFIENGALTAVSIFGLHCSILNTLGYIQRQPRPLAGHRFRRLISEEHSFAAMISLSASAIPGWTPSCMR